MHSISPTDFSYLVFYEKRGHESDGKQHVVTRATLKVYITPAVRYDG